MAEEWNMEEHRNPSESKTQWEMRKEFLNTNKGSLPDERLVSLSNAMISMLYYGCKYPPQAMELIQSMGKEIIDKFNEKKKKAHATFLLTSSSKPKSKALLSQSFPQRNYPGENRYYGKRKREDDDYAAVRSYQWAPPKRYN